MRLLTTIAIGMVKDEADVIEGTLRHLAAEVDEIIVADNLSSDGTRDLLDKLAADLPLTVLQDLEPAYYQSAKMSSLAALAALEHGATWIVPFDADEIWVSRGGHIAEDLAASDADIITADLFHHIASAIDPEGDDPFRTIVWRQPQPAALPKVAFRWQPGAVIHQGNHGVTLPAESVTASGLEIRHFPFRSVEQFVRKARNGAAAYRATDLPADVGAHWRGYGDLLDRFGEEALHDVFREHFWHLSPADAGLVRDPAPFLRWKETA